MAFVVQKNPHFARDVVVLEPTIRNTFERQQFRAIFRVLPDEEQDELLALIDAGGDTGTQKRIDRFLLERVWTGWEGLVDAEGKSVPFSEEVRAYLMGLPYVALPVINAYMAGIGGRATKN